MRSWIYSVGKGIQLTALLAMPAAIWVTEVVRSERMALTIFLGCIVLFLVGTLLTRATDK